MELDEADRNELMRFETVQTAKDQVIEFDKIKISDVSYTRPFFLISIAWSKK
jgi:hypothetical protein